ncbi:hypothetical protein RA2_00452 [Roseovarius sp. A-2]|uniref:Lnb N-terminal periplasmic domain-containing protein n=1 Tax=Roseovarius sp. A-2 TaxID=1570360 RepID=UPI0009B58DE7|nr:DUF4105 domain-containing protein [Roseovarius sp. A-2]GAW33416.1 hypothetical protein RA2_00452 [Roseovarius sp. A-2]
MRELVRFCVRGLALALLLALVVWIGLSLHFQVSSPLVYLLYLAIALWCLVAARMLLGGQWGRVLGLTVLALAGWALWWSGIEPRQDRDWMAEVSRGVTSEPTADGLVRLRNIRNFRWSSPSVAVEDWYDLEVDPHQIRSVDMIMSIWNSPEIAHTLVSFGFADGRHIVFSGEIRKENGEDFSALGGFFKRYELVLIAADERDIVHLRTDARGEAVSLYPVAMSEAQRMAFFFAFLDYANALAQEPRWYHTIWTNCTTMPYRLVRQVSEGLVFDPRIVLSGRLPGYLYDLRVLPGAGTVPLAVLKERAQVPPRDVARVTSVEYSRLLRQRWRD